VAAGIFMHKKYAPEWNRTTAHGSGGRCSIH
jgi:hypothetical protein